MKIKANIANSYLKRLFGLLNKNNKTPLLLNTRFGIHTFFLSFPIDVLILDRNLKVVKQKARLAPFRFYFYNPQYSHVLELKVGFIAANNIKLGDKIDFIS